MCYFITVSFILTMELLQEEDSLVSICFCINNVCSYLAFVFIEFECCTDTHTNQHTFLAAVVVAACRFFLNHHLVVELLHFIS